VGLTFEKLLVILVIAVIIVGPDRLPQVARSLGQWSKRLREFVGDAKSKLQDELGDEFKDADWRSLDPRQYDPRRIIREALLDEAPSGSGAGQVAAGPNIGALLEPGELPPFDVEAT